jgi:hypothetical protein
MTGGLKLIAQLDEVEYLAIERNTDAAGFVVHRLRAAGQIGDAQAHMPKADTRPDVHTATIRPAVLHRRQHGADFIRADCICGIQCDDSSDTTHSLNLCLSLLIARTASDSTFRTRQNVDLPTHVHEVK